MKQYDKKLKDEKYKYTKLHNKSLELQKELIDQHSVITKIQDDKCKLLIKVHGQVKNKLQDFKNEVNQWTFYTE